ncbi:MAG: hypothetical protein LBL45_08265 [Treponema sp.]|jgi:hypothetical protein|nr:hypothetical protein [Treponema sp.]
MLSLFQNANYIRVSFGTGSMKSDQKPVAANSTHLAGVKMAPVFKTAGCLRNDRAHCG